MANRKIKKSAHGKPDSDIPEMKAAEFCKARPAKVALPGLIAAAKRSVRRTGAS